MLKLTDTTQDGVVIVTVSGRLDGAGAPEAESYCCALIREGATRLLLDVADVDYISSAGLRSLLVVAKTMKSANGSLLLCCLSPMVREVMEISGFDKILNVATDRDTALSSLS